MSVYKCADFLDFEWQGSISTHYVHLYPQSDGFFWVTVSPKESGRDGTTWANTIPRRDILWRIQSAGVDIRELWHMKWIDCGAPGYRGYWPEHPMKQWERDAEKRNAKKAKAIPGPVVYFIRAESTGLIKIGKANNPISRLRSMQTGSSDRLTLVGYIKGSHAEEKALHKRFASRRRSGEWFEPDEELLSMIASEATAVTK